MSILLTGEKGYTLHVHTVLLAVEKGTLCASILLALERDTLCTGHTDGGGNGYTLHFHSVSK
jgi:hypothetical protein